MKSNNAAQIPRLGFLVSTGLACFTMSLLAGCISDVIVDTDFEVQISGRSAGGISEKFQLRR